MLRVGLTGGLGSGKSTAADRFKMHGAHVIKADVLGLLMMSPGEAVYDAIVSHFGQQVVQPDGKLDRGLLARIAFDSGRVEELNSIVHPAVIARQAELAEKIFAEDPFAVVVVESALIFETKHGGDQGWRSRFDCIVLVTASEETRIERYIGTASGTLRDKLRADAQNRIKHQMSEKEKIAKSDFVLVNEGSVAELERQVDELWPVLQSMSKERKPH